MVVCRYFLQGTCKFGDRCRYDHQLNENYGAYNYNSQHNSILRQPNFELPQPQSKPVGAVDVSTLIKSVATDVEAVDKGGQWLLSCYAPFKDKPAIAGFEDLSFEEVRLGYVEAQKNNTIPQYVQQIQNLKQNAIMKFKALQSPNQEVVEMLKAINNTPASPQAGVFANNIFGGNMPTNYGQSNTAVFGQASVFGNQPQANIFAQESANYNQPQANIFGAQTSNLQNQQTIVGSSFPQGNTFGNVGASPVTQNTNSPLFAVNNAFVQQPTSSFQQQTSPFQQQQITQATPVFTQSSSIFGQQDITQPQPTKNMFGNAPTNSPMFPSQVSNNAFVQGNTQQMFSQIGTFGQSGNNLFNQATNSNMSVQSNIFGSSQPTGTFASPGQPIDEEVYSKREDLTEDEMKWFESDNCDIMTVPEKPPPHEMCFGR